MEDFVKQIYEFILFIIETIKDLVASVSGKAPKESDESDKEIIE